MIPVRSSALAACAVLLFALAACRPPATREDRTIAFDQDGRAAFQHGRNGVFIAEPGGTAKRIYESGPNDVALGPPQWDAARKRMAFAVARRADGEPVGNLGDAPADGKHYEAIPVRYVCWLYSDGKLDELFEAAHGDAGAVAAGLVLNWHPSGEAVDFVQQIGTDHRVRTFNLQSRQAEDSRLPQAPMVVLGSINGSVARAAVLSGDAGGLWIRTDGDWWKAPDSNCPRTELDGMRDRRPAWSRDGKRFAFLNDSQIVVCNAATRTTEVWFEFKPEERPTDLHWHPDGNQLGLVHQSQLLLLGGNKDVRIVGDGHVVNFAGWSADGRRLAWIENEPFDPARQPGITWATLLFPDLEARSVLHVAGPRGEGSRVLVQGIRATFPNWSPNGSRLAAWLTVEPRFKVAEPGSIGLRPGDPAVVFNVDSGGLEWLPVNGPEHAQIGHFELQSGRLDAALKRFDEAEAGLGAGEKADWMCFRAITLEKVGRLAEARTAWDRFEPPADAGASPRAITSRHVFILETFVSLGMLKEGAAYFRREPRSVSAAVAGCQLLLLANRKEEYLKDVAERLIPACGGPEPLSDAVDQAVRATLMPLQAEEFTRGLPPEDIRRVFVAAASRWPSLRAGSETAGTIQEVRSRAYAVHILKKRFGPGTVVFDHSVSK